MVVKNYTNDVLYKLLDAYQLTNEIRNKVELIMAKIEDGITLSDEAEIKRILRDIQHANPHILDVIKDFIEGSVVGVSGNFLYSWIGSIIQCLPK